MKDIAKGLIIIIVTCAVFFALYPVILMFLWNNVLVVLFGLKSITFWQSFGLVVLIRLVTTLIRGTKINIKSSDE